MSSLHIYTFVVLRAFMAGAANQAGDSDSFRSPGLASGLQGSVCSIVGATMTVHQFFCILHLCPCNGIRGLRVLSSLSVCLSSTKTLTLAITFKP